MFFSSSVKFHRGKLPHYQPENAVFFLTYLLKGVIPVHLLNHWSATYELAKKELAEDELSTQDQIRLKKELSDARLNKIEAYIDGTTKGPHILKQPKFAKVVMDSLFFCQDRNDFKIIAFCIMSNHVHLIVHQVKRDLSDILRDHKRYTARTINKQLGKEGPLWERETFDHVIRNKVRFLHKVRYVLDNPVIPGIVQHWRDYPYTWLNPEYSHYVFD